MTQDLAKTLDKESTTTAPSEVIDSEQTNSGMNIALQATATGIALLEMEGDDIHHAIAFGREVALQVAHAMIKFFEEKDKIDEANTITQTVPGQS